MRRYRQNPTHTPEGRPFVPAEPTRGPNPYGGVSRASLAQFQGSVLPSKDLAALQAHLERLERTAGGAQ